jgi:hypothetical protein
MNPHSSDFSCLKLSDQNNPAMIRGNVGKISAENRTAESPRAFASTTVQRAGAASAGVLIVPES